MIRRSIRSRLAISSKRNIEMSPKNINFLESFNAFNAKISGNQEISHKDIDNNAKTVKICNGLIVFSLKIRVK